mmetsp:Transcript_8813/g.17591  ORF Transcript_8813/g.17591 Transcript_8813/m.17591 type:complete len:206 (-) Transcript_8813:165-782(-)
MYLRSTARRRAVWAKLRSERVVQPRLSCSAPQMLFQASPSPRSFTRSRALRSACVSCCCPTESSDSVSCTRLSDAPPPTSCSQFWSMPMKMASCISTSTMHLKSFSVTEREYLSLTPPASSEGSVNGRPAEPKEERKVLPSASAFRSAAPPCAGGRAGLPPRLSVPQKSPPEIHFMSDSSWSPRSVSARLSPPLLSRGLLFCCLM